jgi:tRNA 2-thiouridine synthesizing protein A
MPSGSMPVRVGLLKSGEDRRMPVMSETLLDVKGMNCPLPVLRANRTLRGLAPGDRLRVLATDRAAVADFQAYCRETGHALLAWSEEGGVLSFLIRRRPEPGGKDGDPAPTA